jgi:predicted HTH transcriptional regulator
MNISQEIRELLYQIRLGEDSSVEFKQLIFKGDKIQAPNKKSLADEIAAFANSTPGCLILGVDDKTRDVIGIPLEKLDAVEDWVREICLDQINPPPPIIIRRHEVPDYAGEQKPILVIYIEKSLFVHQSPDGYFYRYGSAKRQMPPDFLARLFQQRSQVRIIYFDEQAVPNTTFSDLEPEYYRRFLPEYAQSERIKLEKMHLLTSVDQEEKLSVSGVLMCTSKPQEWLPNAYIQAVFYASTTRDANHQIDAQDCKGTLDQQISQALFFVEKNMLIHAEKQLGRIDKPQYSLKAVFEALVNAVAHRDYSLPNMHIRLHLFSDRLQINSPGNLSNSLNIESMEVRQATRNQLLASLLARCPVNHKNISRHYLMDKRGEGVPIIFSESLKLSGRKPQYRLLDETEVELTIWAAKFTS